MKGLTNSLLRHGKDSLREKTERVWYSHNTASSEVVPNHWLHNYFNIRSFGCCLRIVLRCNSMPQSVPLCCGLVAQWHLHSHPSTINFHRPTTQTSYDDLCRLMLRGYSQLSKESKEQEHGHRGTNSNQNQDRWDLCMKCICFLCRNMLVHHNLWIS